MLTGKVQEKKELGGKKKGWGMSKMIGVHRTSPQQAITCRLWPAGDWVGSEVRDKNKY